MTPAEERHIVHALQEFIQRELDILRKLMATSDARTRNAPIGADELHITLRRRLALRDRDARTLSGARRRSSYHNSDESSGNHEGTEDTSA